MLLTRTNRWFTETGRKKRIPESLKPFRQLIPSPAQRGQYSLIELIKNIRRIHPAMSLHNATSFAVYLTGIFNNSSGGPIFTAKYYDNGKVVAENLRISERRIPESVWS